MPFSALDLFTNNVRTMARDTVPRVSEAMYLLSILSALSMGN